MYFPVSSFCRGLWRPLAVKKWVYGLFFTCFSQDLLLYLAETYDIMLS